MHSTCIKYENIYTVPCAELPIMKSLRTSLSVSERAPVGICVQRYRFRKVLDNVGAFQSHAQFTDSFSARSGEEELMFADRRIMHDSWEVIL